MRSMVEGMRMRAINAKMAAVRGVVLPDDASLFQWLTTVGRKLSPEGLHLLKTLYLPNLQLRKLSQVKDPRRLHDLPLERDAASFWRGERPRDCQKMAPQDSLALFIHRLKILVPQSTGDDKLGAQDCLVSLERCGVTEPTLNFMFSQESKMLECLVRSYVNTNPSQQQLITKRALAQQVGINVENATIFDIFVELFTNQGRQKRCENVVAEFVTSLEQARSPREVYVKLKHNLRECDGPHESVPIPEDDPEPFTDEELASAIQPLLDDRDRKHKKSARRHFRKRARVCVCFCLPVLLGLLLFAMAMAIFSTYLNGETFTLETSSNLQMQGPLVVPVFVGKFNSFWYESVTITQYPGPATAISPYVPQNMKFFKIPAHKLRIYSNRYPPLNESNSDILLDQLYLLKGSTLNFTIVVNSTNISSSGFVNLTICNSRPSYLYSSGTGKCKHHQVTVKPRESKLLFIDFVAPHNSYYYITTIGASNNADVVFYNVDINLKVLNFSDWNGMEYKTSISGDSLRFSLGDMFESQDYVIVANITADPDDRSYGQLTVTEHYRSFVYVVPAMAAIGLMCLGVTLIVLVCMCHYIVRKIIRRKNRGNELYDYATRTV